MNSKIFQKYKYTKPIVDTLISSDFSITQAKIFYEVYNTLESFEKCARIIRLIHTLFKRICFCEKQEEYLMSKEYAYDLTMDNYDFMEYFLSVAFGDISTYIQEEPPIPIACLYGREMTLQKYMDYIYSPSKEWRIRFTNYNKAQGKFDKPRTWSVKLDENMEVTLEFHYYYIRYYINGREVYSKNLSVQMLYDKVADEKTFLLLLPIADIGSSDVVMLNKYLKEILPKYVKFPLSSSIITGIITDKSNYNKKEESIKSRRYIENLETCYYIDVDVTDTKKLYSFNQEYGCFEYVGQVIEEDDYEEYEDFFVESDISLPYEVETKVYDLSKCKPNKKPEALLDIFRENHKESDKLPDFLSDNKVILAFGDKNRIHLRQHIETGIISNVKRSFLDMYIDKLKNYAKEEFEWIAFVNLENYYNEFPIAKGVSGNYYAYVSVSEDKKYKASTFEKVFAKAICFEDLTQVIEYEICDRSDLE